MNERGSSGEIVLSVEGLCVYFRSSRGIGRAVDGVNLQLRQRETVALVGESGSGKSVTALGIMGLVPPSGSVESGRVLYWGEDLLTKTPTEMRRLRGSNLAMVLQDPLGSLNPSFTIGQQLCAALRLHNDLSRKAARERAVELLRLMRVPDPEERLASYPHQLSGGMRQRVVGAIALSGGPELLIADEPTTALDATVQVAYLDLLRDVQEVTGVTVLFITHDLGILANFADRILVMYAGEIVESAATASLFARPMHPYTKGLLKAVPDVDKSGRVPVSIQGSPPSIFAPVEGCRFRPRCSLYEELGRPARCITERPAARPVGDCRKVACHFADASIEGS